MSGILGYRDFERQLLIGKWGFPVYGVVLSTVQAHVGYPLETLSIYLHSEVEPVVRDQFIELLDLTREDLKEGPLL